MAEWLTSIIAGFIEVDERFIMHRYYSTRLAMIVGIIMIFVWFNYEYFVRNVVRLDLAIIAGAMAITKVAAMAYYRLTQ
jgi:hypothetical protein